ncbi:hypothetical protein JCM8547_000818 [Rhodosporidiobolus lusitaniae]
MLPAMPNLTRLVELPMDVLEQLFAACLAECVHKNNRLPTKGVVTRFHSKQPPPLEIRQYLARLIQHTPLPRDAILLGIVYLNRISHLPYTAERMIYPTPLLPLAHPWRNSPRSVPALLSPSSPTTPSSLAPPMSPLFAAAPIPPSPTISSVERPAATPILNSYTLHRLVLATLLVATKFTCDGMLSQPRAAKVGGVAVSELGKLEGEVIRLLGWGLCWSCEEIERSMKDVVRIGEEKGVLEKLPSPAEGNSPNPDGAAEDVEKPSSPSTSPPQSFLPFSTPPRPIVLDTPQRLQPFLSVSTSTSAPSTAPSSAAPSEYSASQPSSSASSPRLFSPPNSARGKQQSYFATVAAEGEEESGEDEVTPPSSPSVTSAEDDGKEDPLRRDLSSKGSDETVRRLEGVSLSDR